MTATTTRLPPGLRVQPEHSERRLDPALDDSELVESIEQVRSGGGSPVALPPVPHAGHWNIVVDLGGYAGHVNASVS